MLAFFAVVSLFLAGCADNKAPQPAAREEPTALPPEHFKRLAFESPSNNSFLSGKSRVAWRGTGPVVNVGLVFSADGGNKWVPLALSSGARQFFFDTTQFADGTKLIFRVFDKENTRVFSLAGGLVVDNSPPKADCGSFYEAVEGGTVNLSAANSSDAVSGIRSFEWAFGGNKKFDSAKNVSAVASVAVRPGSFNFPFSVKVTDEAGNSAVSSCNVSVRNVAPEVRIVANKSAAEGTPVLFEGEFSDHGRELGANFSFTWNFGDGSVVESNLSATHQYHSPSIYTVTLMVSDGEAASSAVAFANISNVKPTPANVSVARESYGLAIFNWDVNHPPGPTISTRVEYALANVTPLAWATACSSFGRPYRCFWNTSGAIPGKYAYRITLFDGTEPATFLANENLTVPFT